MFKIKTQLLVLATLSVTAASLSAQTPTSQPAPIERSAPSNPDSYGRGYSSPRHVDTLRTLVAGQPLITTDKIATARPSQGILVRLGQKSSLTAISVDPHHTELRLDHGLLNLNVHYASDDDLILVDLPGGQAHPLKNGLYTFNAATNTMRVLKGEAEAFPSSNPNAKPLKVKEEHAVTFAGTNTHPMEFGPSQAQADLIPYAVEPGYGRGGGGYYAPGYAGFYPGYAYAPYDDGLYGVYGYPYYGFPYGYLDIP